MELNKEFYYHLDMKKIEINWNKNPIPMEKFLSFLTIPVLKSTDHLGYSNGWTRFYNDEFNLSVKGGVCDGGHWLHDLQFGHKLHNPYNNYVSPFYLFEVFTDEGKVFFVNYYKKEIKELMNKQKAKVKQLNAKLKEEKILEQKINLEVKKLFDYENPNHIPKQQS